MRAIFKGKKITGLLGVLPQNEILFEDEVSNYTFPEKQTLRLKKVMGYEKHRVVKENSSSSDLCISGLEYLISAEKINMSEIGAIIVVSTTQDHFMPNISNIIQGEFGFDNSVFCVDIVQGCVGFLHGLVQSFMISEYLENKKVLLFNVDTLSKKVSKQDRNSYPLIGDAATITVVENDSNAKDIHFCLYNDGTKRDALIIPAGGSRLACSPETAKMNDLDNDGNLRSLENLKMNGTEVFTFVQTEVPPLIEEILGYSKLKKEDIDWYLFHQPNKFMLKKLAEKLGIPYEKMPMNIVENYGNPSGASIPITAIHNLRNELTKQKYKCCLSGFGSGLTWAAMTIELGDLDFCEMHISDL